MLLAGGPTPVFSDYVGAQESGPGMLALIPDDTSHLGVSGTEPLNDSDVTFLPPSPIDDCWRWPYPDHELTADALLKHVEIPSGESLETTYSLLDYRNPGCLPAGEYGFEDTVELLHGTRDEHRFHQAKRRRVSLGFALVVDDGGTVSASERPPAPATGDAGGSD